MESSLGLLGGGGREEAELELGLGLSLGGGAAEKEKEKGRSCAWGEYGRILTAKDFPNGFASGRGGKRERVAVDEGSASAAVSQVVGWPPIRSYRMNTLFNHAKTSNLEEEEEEEKGVGGDENNESSKKKVNHGSDKNNENSIKETRGHLGFVKVNMDGLPIGRKVDLNSHKSYQTLAKTLEEMFITPSQSTRGGKEQGVQPLKLLDGSSEFVLTYEDKEGDWMLVGDVPWGMFINTVKRFRIMRTSEANGLAPKSQERNERQKSKIK